MHHNLNFPPMVLADELMNVGILKYNSSQFEDALQAWQKALEIYRDIQNKKKEGIALGQLGLVYGIFGNRNREFHCLSKSLSIAKQFKDYQAELRALINLGNAYQSISEYTQAINFYQKSLLLSRQLKDKVEEAKSMLNLGSVHFHIRKYNEAIDFYEKSLKIWQETRNTQGEAKCLLNIGNAYGALGNYSQAIKYQQQRLTIAEKLGDRRGLLYAFLNIGYTYDLKGDWAKAIEYHQQALTIAREIQDRRMEGQITGNIGSAYLFLRNCDKSIEYSKLSLNIRKEVQDRQGEIYTLGYIANAYSNLSDYYQAINYYQQALEIAKNIKARDSEGVILSGIGNVFCSQKEWATATEYFKQSLSIAQEINNIQSEGSILGSLGLIYFYLEDYHQAIAYLRQGILIAQNISDLPEQANHLNNLGGIFLKLKNFTESEKLLRKSIEIERTLFSKLGKHDDYKVSFFEKQSRSTYRLLQDVLVAQNKTELALEIAEQGRAKAFVDLLTLRFFSQPDFQPRKSISLEGIQKLAIDNGLTLIEYSIIYDNFKIQETVQTKESKLYIWLIQATGNLTFHEVDLKSLWQHQNTSLSKLVIKARESITIEEPTQQDFSLLHKLHKLLIEHIAHLLPTNPNSPIVFIPQEILFLVPFAALQDSTSKYLTEKHNIITAPSIQVLELIQKRSTQVSETSLDALVVGNPKMPTIPLTEPPVELEDLAWAKTEAQVIAPLLNTQAIMGADATKVEIQQQMPKARLIHLATHGLLDDIRQLGIPGAVALAPSNDDNGFLTAGEIYDMKLNADLVVLSACSTGQGKITGDGVVGLSRCLIAAGVKSVIVSLWSVGDLSTALLMVKFYQILQQGVAATIALNQAQRWLLGVTKKELEIWVNSNKRFFDATLKNNLNRRLHQLDDNARLFQHPRYWAAFFAIGQ
jgi:CHAT domain-containing protein